MSAISRSFVHYYDSSMRVDSILYLAFAEGMILVEIFSEWNPNLMRSIRFMFATVA